MALSWDWLISASILIWLFLVIAAKMTRQSIPDLLTGLKDFATGRGEDAIEAGEQLAYYD
ncbi:hypothetical protein BMS3Abin17_00037 [archaeon BMS3Abin17]|nr:hypothetical protein BMS3Abin17_00037 [archaeon BMS3Abin17]